LESHTASPARKSSISFLLPPLISTATGIYQMFHYPHDLSMRLLYASTCVVVCSG
jgi:hypothetical protein